MTENFIYECFMSQSRYWESVVGFVIQNWILRMAWRRESSRRITGAPIVTALPWSKAIYIRLGDWSFLNGDKTNFVEVFKHWLSLKSFTNHELGSPTSTFMSISCGVMVASLPVDQLGVSSNLRGNSFFSHFYRGLLQNILHEVK